MSVKSFKFVSPGVFINEIDNSFIPKTPELIGPVVMGRTERGQALRPIKVDSFSEFIQNFGYPIAGARGLDVSREGNDVGPTYGPFAAQAYLDAKVGPVTFVRLLGAQHDDATSTGLAGWNTANLNTSLGSNGGAYGLLIVPSASIGTAVRGTLAAVWYMKEGYAITLSGTLRGFGPDHISLDGDGNPLSDFDGTAALFGSTSSSLDGDFNSFTAHIRNETGGTVHKTSFNLDPNSEKFIRKRFNTNPQLTNTTITPTANVENYWLGETYERSINSLNVTGSSYGAIVAIQSGSTKTGMQDMKMGHQNATAGWFIGQDLTSHVASYNSENTDRAPKLFKLHGLENGAWLHKHVKVSIERIVKSKSKNDKYGSFSVVLRSISDNDNAIKILERFDNCNLNPASPNYVGRKIGDQYYTWNEGERRLRLQGDYPNQSKFVRVEVDSAVSEGTKDPLYIPFGFYGPPKFRDFVFISGSTHPDGIINQAYTASVDGTLGNPGAGDAVGKATFITAGDDIARSLCTSASFTFQHGTKLNDRLHVETAEHFIHCGRFDLTASIEFPQVPLRVSASDATMGDVSDSYFGFTTGKDRYSTEYDLSIPDILRPLPADVTSTSPGVVANSVIFTLDDIRRTGSDGYWVSGSRLNNLSITAQTGSYEGVLDAGFNKFTAPFFGGYDGFDIAESEPLRNSQWSISSNALNSYAFNTVKRAIDTIADPEFVEMNLVTIPGLTNAQLTTHLINVCEDRGDALAVVDIENVYTADAEGTETVTERKGTVAQAVTSLRSRSIDSSYGCTFYPWVQIKDQNTGRILWAPPSVAMLGVFASSEAKSELWFAPAGFNRGGLTDGAAGLPVLNVSERLTSEDRDTLYEANINPIASFPDNGIVVFGQKTLQERQSALDRINVRRLTIYLKKQISRMATRVLFDQNVEATWNRFKALVEPFLSNTKARFGISEYRLILDESTTTPDLIDQNIMYAKIMIKPARAIEFIAIDFVIASTGASFDD